MNRMTWPFNIRSCFCWDEAWKYFWDFSIGLHVIMPSSYDAAKLDRGQPLPMGQPSAGLVGACVIFTYMCCCARSLHTCLPFSDCF